LKCSGICQNTSLDHNVRNAFGLEWDPFSSYILFLPQLTHNLFQFIVASIYHEIKRCDTFCPQDMTCKFQYGTWLAIKWNGPNKYLVLSHTYAESTKGTYYFPKYYGPGSSQATETPLDLLVRVRFSPNQVVVRSSTSFFFNLLRQPKEMFWISSFIFLMYFYALPS